VNEGFWLIRLAAEKICQAPLAAIDIPFSTNFIGACMLSSLLNRAGQNRLGQTPDLRAIPAVQMVREMIGDFPGIFA
jgi:hypothetical protein